MNEVLLFFFFFLMLTMNKVLLSLHLENTFCAPCLRLACETVRPTTTIHILKLRLTTIVQPINEDPWQCFKTETHDYCSHFKIILIPYFQFSTE